MGKPEPAIDVAKRMLDPFLDHKTAEKLFNKVLEHLHELFDCEDGVDEACALPILIDVVEGVKEHWQQKQKKVEASATGLKLCSAHAHVMMVMPGVLQIGMVCQGPPKHLHDEMVSKAVSAIRGAAKRYHSQGG